MRALLWLVLTCMVTSAPVAAQPAVVDNAAAQAAAAALLRVELPPRDRAALAVELLGVQEIGPRPVTPRRSAIGDIDTFNVVNVSAGQVRQVTAEVRAQGEHLVVWVEAASPLMPSSEAKALVDAFDNRVYDAVRALWGSESLPGIDGDPRIHALFASGLGDGYVAYYASEHTYPREVAPHSNEHEMVLFNLDALAWGLDARALERVVAHEFQHMIRDHVQSNGDTWLNEGLSMFTELLLYGADGAAIPFLSAPNTQLNAWSEDVERRGANYGAAMLFTTYFFQRYGLEALQQVSRSDQPRALEAFNQVLEDRREPDVNRFFADWALANYVLDPYAADGRYGYTLLPRNLPRPVPRAVVEEYPHIYRGRLAQYATDYLLLRDAAAGDNVSVRLSMPSTAPLIDAAPPAGPRFWYSNRADETVTTLTRAFDLRALEHATLEYAVWYALEADWDFGYVLVSRDDGSTWDVVSTPGMTFEDPLRLAYGPAYTGQSDGWQRQAVRLDAYAGNEILVRFAVITDDTVTLTGMAIDDVRIQEVGYASDFEQDDGGWDSRGWGWVENMVPQHIWVQTIQFVGGEPVIHRRLAAASDAWLLPVTAQDSEVVIAISPFAPVTLSAVDYTLELARSD